MHHQTYLANAQINIEGIAFRGSLLESSPGSPQLDGELCWSVMEFGFDEIVGLELPNFQSLMHVAPISPSDRYPVVDARLLLPQGTSCPGAAAFSQAFDSATIAIGGSSIVVNPGANRLRANLLPQLPTVEGVVAQVSIPSATLKTGDVNLPLSNAHVDVFRKTFGPTINTTQRALLYDTVMRFGIVSGPIQFPLYKGSTRDIPHNDLGLDKVIRLFTTLLNKANIAVPAGAFDVLAKAFADPATQIIGDILGKLSSVIEVLTGFGIDDFGIRVKTHDVTARLLPSPASNSSRVAVALKVHLPEIGAFVSFTRASLALVSLPGRTNTAHPPRRASRSIRFHLTWISFS